MIPTTRIINGIILNEVSTISVHAEEEALRNLNKKNKNRKRSIVKSYKMLILRFNREGDLMPDSKPCCHCLETIRNSNSIKSVFFMQNGILTKLKI